MAFSAEDILGEFVSAYYCVQHHGMTIEDRNMMRSQAVHRGDGGSAKWRAKNPAASKEYDRLRYLNREKALRAARSK